MSEHSSTPWRYGNTGPEQVMILGDNGSYVCSVQIKQTGGGFIASAMEPERQANAAFIVKAVNCHDTLVNVLTDARNALASLPMESLGYASDPMGEQIHWPIRDELLYRIDNALSASIKEPT